MASLSGIAHPDGAGPLRVAVLGCGRIGRHHAGLLAGQIHRATLACVYDTDPHAAGAAAAAFGVGAARSVDEALDAADAVAICTSTDSHAELIVAAAGARLAIFCEKPVSLDEAEAAAGVAAVEAAGVPFQIGFNRRFDPAHRSVADAVRNGDIGELHLVRITSRDPAPPPVGYVARSGGLFLDMTIHDFDMARFVTGSEVVEAFGVGAVRVDPAIGAAGDIDTAVVVLRHADGTLTTIDNSRRAEYGYDQRVEAFGSGGMAASANPPAHTGYRLGGDGFVGAPFAHFFLDRYSESYVRQWESFVRAVADGGPTEVGPQDALAPLRIGLAARRSLDSGQPVPVAVPTPA